MTFGYDRLPLWHCPFTRAALQTNTRGTLMQIKAVRSPLATAVVAEPKFRSRRSSRGCACQHV
jgi:hypothetical protein